MKPPSGLFEIGWCQRPDGMGQIGGQDLGELAVGGLTEGVMYAILLGNAISPLISTVTQPRVFGATTGKGPRT